MYSWRFIFFFQAEDGIRYDLVTGVQTCALPICQRAAKGIAKHVANGKTWLRKARASLLEYGNALIGCIDGRARQGWRGSHLKEQSEEVVTEVIKAEYLSKLAPKKSAAYGAYRNICKSRGYAPVSKKTFFARIKRYAADKLAAAREGAMAAAAVAAPVSEETLLAGGGRWHMHVAHLDEFILDLSLIFPALGLALGTPWVAVMID